MKKHDKECFFFPEDLVFNCIDTKDYGFRSQVIWSENITKKKKKEILSLLKKSFEDNIVFVNKHFIPYLGLHGITYTKYSNFQWSKNYPNQLSCNTTTIVISKDSILLQKSREFINPEFKKPLIKKIDALQGIRTKFDTIIKQLTGFFFYKDE